MSSGSRVRLGLPAAVLAALIVSFTIPSCDRPDAAAAGSRPTRVVRAAPIAPAMGRLVLRDTSGRETKPLEVRELRVRAHILGPVALTEIEQTFFNPTDRRAEGIFYFPVPAGASLSRLAMYVDGTLVEGELVERARAREVYESIVRRMKDPALMEWQEGNVFKTRIFPIPARGPKRILIAYTQLLPSIDGERRYVYPLVSKTTQVGEIGRFDFDLTVADHPVDGRLRAAAYPNAEVARTGDATRLRLTRESFRPHDDVAVTFMPRRSGPLELIADRRRGEDGFFLLSYLPTGQDSRRQRREPRDVVLVVDTSLSRRPAEHRAQLVAVRTLLGALRPGDRFAVISFDVHARLHQEGFVSGQAETDAALAALERIRPLGGTDIEVAFTALETLLTESPPRGRPDVVFLGDGIAALGETDTRKLVEWTAPLLARHRARFHGIAVGTRQDRLLLDELARRTGGLVRTVAPGEPVEGQVAAITDALLSRLTPAPEIRFGDAGITGVYPRTPGTLVEGEEAFLLGRYSRAGKLDVTVEQDGRTVHTADLELPEADSRNVFIPRLWARRRLDALLLEEQTSAVKTAIVALSQEFTLITPYTSFLVLEGEDAYKRFRIARQRRRRYWEEMGKLRSAPPPEEVAARQPTPEPAPKRKRGPFSLADFDLSLLTERHPAGRVVSTALSALALEVYFRYLPVYRRTDSASQLPSVDLRMVSADPVVSPEPRPVPSLDVEAVAGNPPPPPNSSTLDLPPDITPLLEERPVQPGQAIVPSSEPVATTPRPEPRSSSSWLASRQSGDTKGWRAASSATRTSRRAAPRRWSSATSTACWPRGSRRRPARSSSRSSPRAITCPGPSRPSRGLVRRREAATTTSCARRVAWSSSSPATPPPRPDTNGSSTASASPTPRRRDPETTGAPATRC